MVSDIGCGAECFSFQSEPKKSHRGHPSQSFPFSKLLYCQQFSGAACPIFSSIKATVDSTVIYFRLDLLQVSF